VIPNLMILDLTFMKACTLFWVLSPISPNFMKRERDDANGGGLIGGD